MSNFLSRLIRRKPKPLRPTNPGPSTTVTSNRSELRPVTLTARNLRYFMERVPISYLAVGRITESDMALAATTPILGQYAPTFGWPDDWGWYWEYLDAYMFIPEVAFAVKTKTRLIWKPGFEIEASSDTIAQKLLREWKRRKVSQSLFHATKNAMIWGNAYLESVDNSFAKFEQGLPSDVAMGAAYDNPTGAPRPLKEWIPATKFYGLKNTDPRTMRLQIHPQRWDKDKADVLVEKVIQRRWSGPLAPTAIGGSDTEIDFHPDQMLRLQFNKITGGIYGYCSFRETLFPLKGYMIMLQFLPTIVQKRADMTLLATYGGNMFDTSGRQVSVMPTEADLVATRQRVEGRMAGEEIYADFLTKIEQVFKDAGQVAGIEELINDYRERVMLGLEIPQSVVTSAGGQEIKWGSFQFELLEDSTREGQQAMEEFCVDNIIPKLMLNLGHKEGDGPEVDVRTSDDQGDKQLVFPQL
jgi:hypothetical protein